MIATESIATIGRKAINEQELCQVLHKISQAIEELELAIKADGMLVRPTGLSLYRYRPNMLADQLVDKAVDSLQAAKDTSIPLPISVFATTQSLRDITITARSQAEYAGELNSYIDKLKRVQGDLLVDYANSKDVS